MTTALWKALLDLVIEAQEHGLSCQECYNLMDQYADILSSDIHPSEVMQLVKQHLSHCPRCDELFQAMLLMIQQAGEDAPSARLQQW